MIDLGPYFFDHGPTTEAEREERYRQDRECSECGNEWVFLHECLPSKA